MGNTKKEIEEQKLNRLGQITTTNEGYKIKIIDYKNCTNVIVKFEDDTICRTTYDCFKKGQIKHPSYKDRTGEIKFNRYNSKMTIVKYNSYCDILVKFENGYTVKSNYGSFKKGEIKSPYCKSVYSIGYIGEGKHKIFENNNITKKYKTWNHILERCFSKNLHKKRPTYENCEIYKSWYNYQIFGDWYDDNYYTIDSEVMCLDKDIFVKKNKLYSPETCIFVPQYINTIFTKRENDRGNMPIGVYYCKNNGIRKYEAHCSNGYGVNLELGYYKTPEEAFNIYKNYKEQYIKQVADEYRDKIPKKLYEAMYNYKVEITD